MRKINFFFKIIIICLALKLCEASAIENKIIGYVESQIISSYELKNKIKTNIILTNQIINQENINKSKTQAITTLISYKLKKKEVLNYNVTANKEAVNKHLANIHKRFKISSNEFKEMFVKNNLSYDLYLEEIKTEYAWQKVIFSIYAEKINIDNKEIDIEFNKIVSEQLNMKEYKLAEIEILSEENTKLNQKIIEITDEIEKTGFENTAINYSTSPSASNGGNLDWINSKSLSNYILGIISKMNIGDVSKPIIQGNVVTFLKLTNSRKTDVKEMNLNLIKERIIIKKKNDLLNLFSNNHLSKLKNNSFIEIK